MPGSFTAQFAEQLASVSQIPVKQAENGEPLRAGQAYVCPGDCHLRVAPPGRIVLDDGPRIAGYRPSIDVTLESVAVLAGANAVAAILTGMGNDGARGAHGDSGIRRPGAGPGRGHLGDLRHARSRPSRPAPCSRFCRWSRLPRRSPGGWRGHLGAAQDGGIMRRRLDESGLGRIHHGGRGEGKVARRRRSSRVRPNRLRPPRDR